MSDTDTASAAPSQLLEVAVTKANSTLSIDTAAIPQPVYEAALAIGLKHMVNMGMSKITGLKTMSETELAKAQADAMKIAEKNLSKIMDGSIKIPGMKAKSDGKTPKAILDEARRMAKAKVKAILKEKGYVLKTIPAKELTAAANAFVTANPSILKEAEAAIEARNRVTTSDDSLAAIFAGISAQPAPEKQLSAAQAGKTAKRSRKAKGSDASA
jgi:hypothetical protein